MAKPDKNPKSVFSYFRISPECYGGKLIDNGGVNVLVVLCVIGGEVAKSPLAENHREILLVGDLLEFSSNKLSRKLGEILVLISDLRMIVKTEELQTSKMNSSLDCADKSFVLA